MKKQYFGISSDEGAIGMNDGCKNAPEFLFNLFNIKGKQFTLNGEIDEKQEQIFGQAKEIFENVKEDVVPVFFGGTHDITGFIVKAFAKKNKKNKLNSKLLILDAHADCEDALPSTTTHEDFVRMLTSKNILKGEDIFIIGLRKVSDIEKDYLEENKINYLYFNEINSKKEFEEVKKQIEKFISSGEVYFSFDVDVLSAEIMKATGYFPDGGLLEKQTKELLEIIIPKVKAFDIIEFNPEKINLKEDELLKRLFSNFIF